MANITMTIFAWPLNVGGIKQPLPCKLLNMTLWLLTIIALFSIPAPQKKKSYEISIEISFRRLSKKNRSSDVNSYGRSMLEKKKCFRSAWGVVCYYTRTQGSHLQLEIPYLADKSHHPTAMGEGSHWGPRRWWAIHLTLQLPPTRDTISHVLMGEKSFIGWFISMFCFGSRAGYPARWLKGREMESSLRLTGCDDYYYHRDFYSWDDFLLIFIWDTYSWWYLFFFSPFP